MSKITHKIKIPFGSRAIFLKLEIQYFQDVMNHTKNFEVRHNDRDYKVNDFLVLQEWDPLKKGFTGRRITRRVIYILPLNKLIPECTYVILQLDLTPYQC